MENLLAQTDPLSCVVVVLLVDFMRTHRGWGWMRGVGKTRRRLKGSGSDGSRNSAPNRYRSGSGAKGNF